jgi:Rha family phage regulatory protein
LDHFNIKGDESGMDELVNLGVENQNGIPVVSSRKVAEVFGKEHKDVLKAIDNLDCSSDFNKRNFTPVKYKDKKGEQRREILMTRDGFVFLAMGFTGEKAAKFKEAYIAEFNRRGDELKLRQLSREVRGELTDALRDSGLDDQMRGHAFENVTNNIIYKIAFGLTAPQIREELSLPRTANVREHLKPDELKKVAEIEESAKVLFRLGYSYQEVKQILSERKTKLLDNVSLKNPSHNLKNVKR